jgi:hypothetical protein
MFVYIEATITPSMRPDCVIGSVTTSDGYPVAFTVNKRLVTERGIQCARDPHGVGPDGTVVVHINAAPPWIGALSLLVHESELTVEEVPT